MDIVRQFTAPIKALLRFTRLLNVGQTLPVYTAMHFHKDCCEIFQVSPVDINTFLVIKLNGHYMYHQGIRILPSQGTCVLSKTPQLKLN
jgi:hypothetical protein